MFKLQFEGMPHFSANSEEWLRIKNSDSEIKHVRYPIQGIPALIHDVHKRWKLARLWAQISGPYNEQCATTRLFTALYVKHDRFGSIQQFAESKLTKPGYQSNVLSRGQIVPNIPSMQDLLLCQKMIGYKFYGFYPKDIHHLYPL